jgi:regulator of sigma D
MSADDSFRRNYMEGLNVFQSARMRGFWDEMINLLRGKPAELLSFDDIKARLRLREESYRGLQDVPLDRIVGSVGRYRDFTSSFLPKKQEMQERWSRVYAQIHSMEGVPPIELYKVGDVYFVRDGNHRVSVARRLNSKTIEAHVTELTTPVDLQPGMSEEELGAAVAYASFLEETSLGKTRPHHQTIALSEPSRYTDLLGHINLHQRVMEQVEGQGVTFEEAAANWYDNVYRPAVTLIRKYDILKYLPARTEGDLYLWLVDHLAEVKAQYGEEAEARSFSDALVDFLAEQHIPVPKDLLQEEDPSVKLTRSEVQAGLERERAKARERLKS